MNTSKKEINSIPIRIKILLIFFFIFFVFSIIYPFYSDAKYEKVWKGKTRLTKALYHEWKHTKSGKSIYFEYQVKGKKYHKSEGNYQYPELSAYDETCSYMVEYPIEYPDYATLRTDSCFDKKEYILPY